MRRHVLSVSRVLLAGCLVCLLFGCQPSAPEKTGPSNTTSAGGLEGSGEGQASNAETGAEGDAIVEERVMVVHVQLPSSELTAGIPGDGSLTTAQIQSWIDDPVNHAPVSFELPLGLNKGIGQVHIPEDNLLTKAKIELGRQLYFDTRMSGDGTIACASCHHPDFGYARRDQFGVGIKGQTGNRNSPVSYNRLFSRAQFWDGRADSLETQAKGPIQSPIEHGSNHDDAVRAIAVVEGYQIQFEKIFGSGSVNIDNIARAIASFERVIVTGASSFDYYDQLKPFLDGFDEEDLAELKEEEPETYAKYEVAKAGAEKHPMSDSAIRGHALFFSEKVGCTACHVGANFTDEKYHNLGIGMDQEEPDLGRFAETNDDKDRGAFKTPTIRNVALSAPYMHDGSQKTLEEVVEWYAKGGHPNSYLSDKIKKVDLTAEDKQDLVAFMHALTGDFPYVEQQRIPE